MRSVLIGWIVFLVVSACPAADGPDSIQLRNGRTLQGRFVEAGKQGIVFDFGEDGSTILMTFQRENVKSLTRDGKAVDLAELFEKSTGKTAARMDAERLRPEVESLDDPTGRDLRKTLEQPGGATGKLSLSDLGALRQMVDEVIEQAGAEASAELEEKARATLTELLQKIAPQLSGEGDGRNSTNPDEIVRQLTERHENLKNLEQILRDKLLPAMLERLTGTEPKRP